MTASLGVSRTVVREAVAVLRAEGLVETRQGVGAFVVRDVQRRPFRIDPDGLRSIGEVVQVMELRTGVEVEAAGIAAETQRWRAAKPRSTRILPTIKRSPRRPAIRISCAFSNFSAAFSFRGRACALD